MADTIFPYIQPDAVSVSSALPTLRDVAWDFVTDRAKMIAGVPEVVSRLDAVRVWAWNALKTVRFRWPDFPPGYGCEAERLVGQVYQPETKRAEVQRYVVECLTASPYITAVDNITVASEDDRLTVTFAIKTVYGDMTMEVELNG